MRKVISFFFIIILIFSLCTGSALAEDAFRPSHASAEETTFATVATFICASIFVAVCMLLVMREGRRIKADKTWTFFAIAAVFAVVLRMAVALTFEGYHTDIACFKGWAISVYQLGPANFYTSGMFADYPPGYMYILYILGWIREVFAIDAGGSVFTLMIKLPSIIAEVVTAVILYRIARAEIGKIFGLLCGIFVLFNPAMFFDTAAWGQIDAVFTLFIILTIYNLKKEEYILGALFFAISLLLKPQAIMFAPVVGLAYVYSLFKKGKAYKGVVGILGGALVVAAVLFGASLPFRGSQEPLWLINKYTATVGFYEFASLNAFNLFALMGANFVFNTQPFLLLDYQTWGRIFIVLICITVIVLQWRTRQQRPLFDISAFLIISVFMLAHGMHERYILPACICLIFAYAYSRDGTTLFFGAAFSITALLGQMVTLYGDGVQTAPLPTLIVSAINMALYIAYAIVTIKNLGSGKILIKSPAMYG